MMTNLLIFLLFVSVILLLAGLIRPSLVIRWGENRSRKKVALLFGISALTLLLLIGVTAEPQPRTTDDVQTMSQPEATKAPEESPTPPPTPASRPTPTPTQTPAPLPKPTEQPLSYTILKDYDARLEILVKAKSDINQLKKLIIRVSSSYCGDKKSCIVNVYDDRKAYEQLQDFGNPIYDEGYPESEFKKIEAHFVGQYARWQNETTRRYRQNGQWVNF